MKAINFPESNKHLLKPKGWTDDECDSLPVLTNGKICVSCWELSEEEKKQLLETGKIWLMVWSGHTQPPVCLTTIKPIATENPETAPEQDDREIAGECENCGVLFLDDDEYEIDNEGIYLCKPCMKACIEENKADSKRDKSLFNQRNIKK